MKHSDKLIELLGFGYDMSEYNRKKIDDYIEEVCFDAAVNATASCAEQSGMTFDIEVD